MTFFRDDFSSGDWGLLSSICISLMVIMMIWWWWCFMRWFVRWWLLRTDGNCTAGVFRCWLPVTMFISDGVDVSRTSVFALNNSSFPTGTLVCASIVKQLSYLKSLISMKASVKRRFRCCCRCRCCWGTSKDNWRSARFSSSDISSRWGWQCRC